jgi:hypothetical protein
MPTTSWLNTFFKRHPELTLQTPQSLGKKRALVTIKAIQKWFNDFVLTALTPLYLVTQLAFTMQTRQAFLLMPKAGRSSHAGDQNMCTILLQV